MKLINIENNKASARAAGFLIMVGTFLCILGFAGKNYATAFLGISFAVLSMICMTCILSDKTNVAKILWALGTPVLIFISPLFFTLNQETALSNYSYLYIGGVLYVSWSLQEKNEKPLLWISITLFFLAVLFYDRIIVTHFKGSIFAQLLAQPDNYLNFKIAQITHFLSIVYLIVLIQNNKVKIEKQLSERIHKLQEFTTNLIEVSKNKIIHSGNQLESMKELLRNAAQVMDVSRVSIWELEEATNSIRMVVGYDMIRDTFSYDSILKREMFPAYFKNLLSEKIIIANDALIDQTTQEFSDTYLKPLGIQSMMDTPFFLDGKFKGILCLEEQRLKRCWDETDQLFSVSISKLISICYYLEIRKEQFISIYKTKLELERKNSSIESINQKMMQINGNLAADLSGKEEDIKHLNKFLDQLSFKNAHHVRGPLSRILGLIYIYRQESNPDNKNLYIDYLEKSAEELDHIIKEISDILNNREEQST